MLLRGLVAASLLASNSPAVPQTVEPDPVPKIVCIHQSEHEYTAGTAFRIGPNLLVSVNHVIKDGACQMQGQPIHVIYKSPKTDFAMLSDDRKGQFLKVDCEGFKAGHLYLAVGHARAMDDLTVVPIVATGQYADDGMAVLVGVFTAQPGQSGGPIIDAETKKVVGTVNAANWASGATFSVELKGSSVCGGHDA